jgi:hypothetical protein
LTRGGWPAKLRGMSYSFLIFEFGTNEEAAQQARHRLEGWKQGFRLDKKLQLKFERKEMETATVAETAASASSSKPAKSAKPTAKGKGKQGGKSKSDREAASDSSSKDKNNGTATVAPSEVRLIVRLDFSDHEKLSHQRWIDRIPTEEPFKGANPRVVRTGEPDFKSTSELFDSLD